VADTRHDLEQLRGFSQGESHNLSTRVNTRVRATSGMERPNRLSTYYSQRPLKLCLNCPLTWLLLPPSETGSVVLNY
jgi:hypothetical protein